MNLVMVAAATTALAPASDPASTGYVVVQMPAGSSACGQLVSLAGGRLVVGVPTDGGYVQRSWPVTQITRVTPVTRCPVGQVQVTG